MTSDKETVLSAHPEAACWMNPDSGQFKIFVRVPSADGTNKSYIALSDSWETESSAWYDSAAEVRRRLAAGV